jgi:hypothetical protein
MHSPLVTSLFQFFFFFFCHLLAIDSAHPSTFLFSTHSARLPTKQLLCRLNCKCIDTSRNKRVENIYWTSISGLLCQIHSRMTIIRTDPATYNFGVSCVDVFFLFFSGRRMLCCAITPLFFIHLGGSAVYLWLFNRICRVTGWSTSRAIYWRRILAVSGAILLLFSTYCTPNGVSIYSIDFTRRICLGCYILLHPQTN